MNNLTDLKSILEVVIHADREFSSGTPLYQIKTFFDALVLDDVIDFSSEHGSLLKIALTAKRKDSAMKNIIRARGCIQLLIKALELDQVELDKAQKQQDDLAIESTCIDVTRNDNKEVQLQLTNIPKKIGRPRLASSLTGAERAKKARDKKKASKLVTVNSTLNQESSELYLAMVKSGYDLNSIIQMAHNQEPFLND